MPTVTVQDKVSLENSSANHNGCLWPNRLKQVQKYWSICIIPENHKEVLIRGHSLWAAYSLPLNNLVVEYPFWNWQVVGSITGRVIFKTKSLVELSDYRTIPSRPLLYLSYSRGNNGSHKPSMLFFGFSCGGEHENWLFQGVDGCPLNK